MWVNQYKSNLLQKKKKKENQEPENEWLDSDGKELSTCEDNTLEAQNGTQQVFFSKFLFSSIFGKCLVATMLWKCEGN